jgi:hypothetical protein
MGFKNAAIIGLFALFASLLLSAPARAQITDITLDTPVAGQIATASETKQYRILLSGGGPLFVHLDKPKGWDAGLAIYKDSLSNQPLKKSEAWEDQMLMVDGAAGGTYYVAVWSSGFYYGYHRDLPGT